MLFIGAKPVESKKKILIIKFSAIGDAVHSTIIPSSIKIAHPDWEIHYLTSSYCAKILKNCPYIDKVLIYKNSIIKTAIELFEQKYDILICLNNTIKSFVLSFLSFPKQKAFKSKKGISWVENYFYSAKKIVKDIVLPDRLYLQNDRNTEISISEKLNKFKKPIIVLNPGKYVNQTRQGRVWNILKWKELSEKIIKKYGGTVLVSGSKDEREYHLPLKGENIIVLSGLFNLEESCAVISLADLVISGDSGPIHIASGYNVKTLALLGSTSPDKIKPFGQNGYYIEPRINCRYCWKKKCRFLKGKTGYSPCIESICADMVMDKIKNCNLLEEKIKC